MMASAAKLRGKPLHLPTPADEVAAQFEAALDACDVVSFDVFDTLVVRQTHHPIEVFLHLEHTAAFKRFSPWKKNVLELRIDAENQARRKLFEKEGSGEATLTEIYEMLCQLNGLPLHEAAALVAAEEAVELTLCIPNPPVQKLFELAVKRGKRILVISDTYHHQDFIVKMIAAKGFPVAAESVYASSRSRLNKQSSQLFRQIFPTLGVPPAHVLHIGDHPISDFQVPRQLGAVAILHPFRPCADQPSPSIGTPAATLHSHIRAICAMETKCGDHRNDFWWLLGHNVFGPLLSGFCIWLERVFSSSKLPRAYFLLRNGEIFHRVYTTLFEGRTATSVATLPSSRRAFILPLLEIAPNLAVGQILAGIGSRPAGEYLSRLAIPADAFEQEFRNSGFQSSQEMVDARTNSDRFQRLLNQPRVLAALQSRSRLERQNLLGYFRKRGVFDGGTVALVDLGWNGTLQKATHLLFQNAGLTPDLVGLYLATFPGFTTNAPAGLRYASYLLREGQPASIAATLGSFRELLEIVCSSASGSLLYFQDASQDYAPVFQANHAGDEQLSRLAEIHEGIVGFARRFRESLGSAELPEIPPEIAAENLFRLLANPTKEEARQIGELSHGDDVGSTTRRFAARFREDSNDPAMLLDDYANSYWKTGLLNQANTRSAVLRTLLWLIQE